MVKAIMHGCNGKMGQVISGLVQADVVIYSSNAAAVDELLDV